MNFARGKPVTVNCPPKPFRGRFDDQVEQHHGGQYGTSRKMTCKCRMVNGHGEFGFGDRLGRA